MPPTSCPAFISCSCTLITVSSWCVWKRTRYVDGISIRTWQLLVSCSRPIWPTRPVGCMGLTIPMNTCASSVSYLDENEWCVRLTTHLARIMRSEDPVAQLLTHLQCADVDTASRILLRSLVLRPVEKERHFPAALAAMVQRLVREYLSKVQVPCWSWVPFWSGFSHKCPASSHKIVSWSTPSLSAVLARFDCCTNSLALATWITMNFGLTTLEIFPSCLLLAYQRIPSLTGPRNRRPCSWAFGKGMWLRLWQPSSKPCSILHDWRHCDVRHKAKEVQTRGRAWRPVE